MKIFWYTVLGICFSTYIYVESPGPIKAPIGWYGISNPEKGLECGIDQKISHSGKGSGFVRSTKDTNALGTYVQSIDAKKYLGKKIRLSAYLKAQDIKGWAGMWMRVDGEKRAGLSFDNMSDRPLIGNTDWTRYEIVLDIPKESKNIMFGILIKGIGTIWIDDVSLQEARGITSHPELQNIQGKVFEEGQPVKGAVVAAISGRGEKPEQIGLTKSDGSFKLAGLKSGKYVIATTARNYQAQRSAEVDLKNQEINDFEIVLKKGGTQVSGLVSSTENKPLPEIYVMFYRYTVDEEIIYYTQTDENGRYSVYLPEGFNYLVAPYDERFQEDVGSVKLNGEPQTLNLIARPIIEPPASQSVLNWIRSNAIPLKTVQARNGFDDMQPLREVVGNARAVCLGEATHGTKDFFQLKHRMLEFLVSEMGFTVFGIEATYPEAYTVNKYVLTGEGDPAEALANLYFWTWNTEEVLDMIRWMREYNLHHDKKVKFYGFDMQFPENAAKFALDYLKKIAGKEPEEIKMRLDFWSNQADLSKVPAEQKNYALKLAKSLVEQFDRNKKEYSASTSEAEWDIARQHARVVQQYTEMMVDENDQTYSVRDSAMAENIRWILNHEGPDAKIVAWAHNGHVSFNSDSTYGKPMGSHLRDAFGNDLVVFGFAFNEGSFQALDGHGKKGLNPFTIGVAPEGSLDATLSKTGLKIAALDLRRTSEAAEANNWFDEKHITRSIGGLYDSTSDKSFYWRTAIGENFDALLFVEKTSAAIPVKKKSDEPPMIFSVEAVNLDFET